MLIALSPYALEEVKRVHQQLELENLVERLLSASYAELRSSTVNAYYDASAAFASVRWEPNLKRIDVVCNRETEAWHEAARTGLIAHELSHPAQKSSGISEKETDIDVIDRKLGLYLAVERLHAGKYEDHLIRRGKDRYLGYRTIRGLLSEEELSQLDQLLADMRFIPRKCRAIEGRIHDVVRFHRRGVMQLAIEGRDLEIENVNPSAEVLVLDNEDAISVLVDGQERARLPYQT
jgi:hypothetical protein